MYPQVFGKYVLERELSRGGMARVLLATLRGAGGFEKKLVVKQIRDELAYDQQFIRRFVEEAKTTVALSHPNIVPVYELGVEQGTYFLAMELVEGVSIADIVRERNDDGSRRVVTPEEGAYIGIEVCRALDYAHRRMRVVHRDITPRNVMIDEEGQVKLIDFGIAAPARVAGHEILGSPGHMPPEQVAGKELGPPTDIFALAVLLMEAWTGIAPFRRPTPEECDAAMREPHPRPSDFDPRLLPLDDAISRAMKVEPKERQQDAGELARALRNFLRGSDMHDIARALGDRVRDIRLSQAPQGPKSEGAPRAAQPSHGDLGTKTFAARDEALHWSSPPMDSPSTRPIGVSEPRLEALKKIEKTKRGRPDDPAMMIPTPLMVEPVSETEQKVLAEEKERSERDLAQKARASSLKDISSEREVRVETIATRPLETPVRPIEPVGSLPGQARSKNRSLIAIALVAVVAIGGIVVWRTRPLPGRDATNPPATTTTPSATPTVVVSVSAPVASSAPAPPPSDATTATPVPTTSAHATTAPSASVVPSGRAAVMLLGDPGTNVSVDGQARGPCPQRIVLEPGQHEARFTFEPTGESRGERFGVKAGDRITVRADFTGATPTVKIIR